MGRLGLEGTAVINGQPTYTPLDLFNYQSRGVLELSANGGHFSINDGRTNLGNYNNAAVNGGDIADWASNTSPTQSSTLLSKFPRRVFRVSGKVGSYRWRHCRRRGAVTL